MLDVVLLHHYMSKKRAWFGMKKKCCSVGVLQPAMKTLHSEVDLGGENGFHFLGVDVRGGGMPGDSPGWCGSLLFFSDLPL